MFQAALGLLGFVMVVITVLYKFVPWSFSFLGVLYKFVSWSSFRACIETNVLEDFQYCAPLSRFWAIARTFCEGLGLSKRFKSLCLLGNTNGGRTLVLSNAREFVHMLIQSYSRLDRSDLHAATAEIGKLKAQLQELEGENEEWRKNYTAVEHIIASLREQLNSKNQEIQRLAPYGSYCVSGANPYFLKKAVQRVSHALNDFVSSIRISAGKPSTDIADLSKDEALVSSILFSKFERVDLGVEGDVAKFIPPPQLPEVSFQEYKAFDAFMEDQENSSTKVAVDPYWGKFRAFVQLVGMDMDKLFPLGQIELNDERHVRFWNLAMCVWMLHKLTLSFDKANVRVMRVGRGEEFNKEYMTTVPGRQEEEHKLGTQLPVVQHLILPGLWINGSIFKCCVFLESPAHQETNCTSESGNQVGATTDQPQTMCNGVETITPEESPESEPQPECNQPATLSSDEITSAGSDLQKATEASHPSHSEQGVKDDTPASADGTATSGECKNDQIVDAQDDTNSEASQLPAKHPGAVPGIGF